MEFLVGILALFFCLEALEHWDADENSTNKPNTKKRWWQRGTKKSGLRVYVDHATGVHYIKSSFFERMQVRINKDGTPYTED